MDENGYPDPVVGIVKLVVLHYSDYSQLTVNVSTIVQLISGLALIWTVCRLPPTPPLPLILLRQANWSCRRQ